MKKRSLLLSVLTFCILHFASAQIISPQQCQGICSQINMDIGPASNGGPITNPNWSYSHGSPSIGPGWFWLWSYNNEGEGINFSGYNFIAGRQYCISYLATTSTHDGSPANASAAFNIVASNGPVVGIITGGGGAPIPGIPFGAQVVHNKPWSTFSGGGQVGNTEWVTFTFTATSNFNNLWFFPSSPTLPQVEIQVSQLIICEINPCEVNFSVQIGQFGATQSTIDVVAWPNPGYYFCNMEIFREGTLVYSGSPVSYIAPPGNYRVCVTFCNQQTGQRCRKCFDFCIGKWTSFTTSDPIENPGSPKSGPIGAGDIPESTKEKPVLNELRIAPNPSNGEFRVCASENSIISTLEIYNAGGVLVKTLKGSNSNTVQVSMDYAPGIYFVKARLQDGKEMNSKIVLE